MKLIQQLLTRNDCYKSGKTIAPKGVMVHSTGANNPKVSRYVPGDAEIGRNTGGNHWNQTRQYFYTDGTSTTGYRDYSKKLKSTKYSACVHAFIGKFANGQSGIVQTLPWTMRGWHCGQGSKGSANNTHISFEICEDGLEDASYFQAVYQAAVELTAYLCGQFDLDPLADGVVICHCEGHDMGIASNHADVMHWFPRFGKTMDDFRADVARQMEGGDDLTEEDVRAIVRSELKQIEADKAALGPDKFGGNADELFKDAVAMGITDGTRPQCGATRQEVALMVRAAVKE